MKIEDSAMPETVQERIDRLKEDFDRQPCARKHRVSLDELSEKSSKFSKVVSSGDCVIDFENSGTFVIQGGVIPVVADFAGVYLARMHSDDPGITPLADLRETYFKPFILLADKKIIARAFISEINVSRIIVTVLIENEKGELKGQARLSFARRFRKA